MPSRSSTSRVDKSIANQNRNKIPWAKTESLKIETRGHTVCDLLPTHQIGSTKRYNLQHDPTFNCHHTWTSNMLWGENLTHMDSNRQQWQAYPTSDCNRAWTSSTLARKREINNWLTHLINRPTKWFLWPSNHDKTATHHHQLTDPTPQNFVGREPHPNIHTLERPAKSDQQQIKAVTCRYRNREQNP